MDRKLFYGGPPRPPKKEKEPVVIPKTKAPVVVTKEDKSVVEEKK